jgi:hypothetical protein
VWKRPERHLGGVFELEAEELQDALGVVAVGIPGRLSVEHGAHDGKKRAAGREQHDLLVGDLESSRLDVSVEIALGERA